mgnify:CR=1 FL=1
MNVRDKDKTVVDYYYSFLKNLNHDSKLDLITKLSESLKGMENSNSNSLQSLFGAYQSEESAEEIISKIRSSRNFNRNLESL